MNRAVYRCLAVAAAVGAFLGADVALAMETDEPVRVPVRVLGQDDQPERVIVVKGDHLWKMSKRHLQTRMQRLPANSEIGPYWRQVIDANVDSLRSGDPDLIYPGEVIEMPEASLSERQ